MPFECLGLDQFVSFFCQMPTLDLSHKPDFEVRPVPLALRPAEHCRLWSCDFCIAPVLMIFTIFIAIILRISIAYPNPEAMNAS